jgi:Tol biopolymer transport system component
MSLVPGSRIGPYEVIGPLGEGGMGVVLRGRDTRLQRDVALKLLPDQFASDADRMFRFQREAQILASLNHPHIAQVFGLEQADGTACIVMELVEGDTLADRLESGPMPLDDVRSVATQLAGALAAAHERGIVHRDLKPANIKVTDAGTVKVLDFGLAKAIAGNQDTQATSLATAVTRSMPGTILGTPGYMSPEQARGRDVDARTDIWAFGCVLYEMLTGRQAFAGETATDVIAQVVTTEPDLAQLPASTPPALRSLLAATLNKNPAQRLQHIGDARIFLDPALAPSPAAGPAALQAAVAVPRWRAKWIAAAAALVLAGAAVPMTWTYFRATAPPASLMQFEMSFPGVTGNVASLAPDGRAFAFIGLSPDGRRVLYVRPITAAAPPQALAGTENVGAFLWSADGQQLAFMSDGKLRKVNASGGSVQALTDVAGQYRGGAWNGGVILLARTADNVIARMADSGGPLTPVTKLDAARKEVLHAIPAFLPDGNRFLYAAVAGNIADSGVFLASLDGSIPPTRVLTVEPRGFNTMAYSPSGHLVIQNEGRVLAYRMDERGQVANGEPAVLAEGIDGTFSISNDDVLMYHKAGAAIGRQLTWFDRGGKAMGTVGEPAAYGGVELSPSGDRAAVDIRTGPNRDIWVMDLARAVVSRTTFEDAEDWSAIWSPDGRQIAYASAFQGSTRLYVKPASNVGERALVAGEDGTAIPVTWLGDGQRIIFARPKTAGSAGYDTWLQPVAGGKPSMFLETPFDKLTVRVSPDSRYVAYSSNESGQYQIFVQTFPDPSGGRWQITSEGGVEPKWRRDGRELYYLGFDGRLMAVPVTGGAGFTSGRPVALFQTPLGVNRAQPSRERRYDVAPDGRFLFVAPTAAPAQTPFTVVVNWTAALK